MKNIKLIVLLIVYALSVKAQGIDFESGLSWKEVQAKAKKENKYIFVDCYTTWCGPCKQMDREVYINTSVGKVFNSSFLSVKMQMDRAPQDNELIRGQYLEADSIGKKYKVKVYPSFLFFSPAGELVHREVGFRNPKDFIQLSHDARDPRRQYYESLRKFKDGTLEPVAMSSLAITTYDSNDKALAKEIAKTTKTKYWNKLSETELLTNKQIGFIIRFPELLSSNDLFFKLCLYEPEKIRPLVFPGGREQILEKVIGREEIDNMLYDGNLRPLSANPSWRSIEKSVEAKYGKYINASSLVFRYKRSFYANTKDWNNFTKTINENIKTNPPKTYHNSTKSDAWQLNIAAWDLFQYSDDKDVLNEALKWIDIAIQLDSNAEVPNHQLYDTKANLLYKTGQVKHAIKWEEKALEIDTQQAKKAGKEKGQFFDNYSSIILKMKKGEPTWPISTK